jgi:NAD(P)-dependent dehydrogenase (short-subunit alcohol dehydrogenase family)
MEMQGTCIVIIGGTGGMGLSTALACVRAGARVVVTGRDPSHADEAIRVLGTGSRVLIADATAEGSAEAAIDTCVSAFGGFTGLYHVAGGSGRKWGDGPLHELSLEGWQRTFALNLESLMLSNRAAVRTFRSRGHGGAILNMGSVLGFSPSPGHFATHAYAAAKSAVVGFSKSLAAYYAKDDIRVNVIAPALVDTPMAKRAVENPEIQQFIARKQPLDGGRTGLPRDLDGLAILLLSDAGRYITGQVIAVDGGWTVSEAGGNDE